MTRRSWIALAALFAAGTPARAGDPAEAHLAAHPLEGTATFSDFRGEVVVVNFWATWCAPCKKELPALQALSRRLGEEGRVVAISVDRDPERVEEFLAANRLDLPVFVDGPEGLARKLDLESLPYSYVLDRDGRVIFAGPGSGSGERGWTALTAAVDRALDQRPPAVATRGSR